MRILFVKPSLQWPRTVGHDVHAFEMMKALAGRGHEVGLATVEAAIPLAVQGLGLSARWTLDDVRGSYADVALTYGQERYRRYWGVSRERIAAVAAIARDWRPDALVVVGLEVLPYLGIRHAPTRIWYAADEWVWHYVTQLRSDPAAVLTNVRTALIKGVYERVFGSCMDRVWVVSSAECRAMRIVAGTRHVDVIPNGVDADAFAPRAVESKARTVVFWGRLGFGPNLQALRWFLRDVWPRLRAVHDDAEFLILGADPPSEVREFGQRPGVRLLADLPDLRPEIARAEVTVLPFVSGGGIKNKLLEAAAMGQAIVATPRALTGLASRPPVSVAANPAEFAAAVAALWRDAGLRATQGAQARAWVRQHHGWAHAAQLAEAAIRDSRPAAELTVLGRKNETSGTERERHG